VADTTEKVEDQSELDADENKAVLKRWLTEIKLYEKKRQKFDQRAKKIIKRFKDEREAAQSNAKRMNVLWANIETLKPTVYARTPKAEVKRRFKDQDPVGRVASMILERSVDYFLDCKDRFDEGMRGARDDYLLIGLGVNWQRYVPHMEKVEPDPITVSPAQPNIPAEGVQIDNELEGMGYVDADGEHYEDADYDEETGAYTVTPEPYETIEYEEVIDDYVHWTDFGHNAGARTWTEVYAVWRKAYLTREELHTRFDSVLGHEAVERIPLDAKPEGDEDSDTDTMFSKATVYEIWDKASKKAIWIHKAYEPGPLDMKDDPLGLEEFFPCPRPLFATLAHDDMIPVPDYAQYQDQAEEIDTLTARIVHLTESLKVRGLYASEIDEIKRLFQDANEAELIPVENWAMYADKGGLANAVVWVPLKDIAEALMKLYEARERAKQDLYEITGLSDILRGQSEASETATAQAIKAQWGSTRVKEKQQELARFARDAIRIKAEIISEHFAPETIAQIANIESLPEQDQPYIAPAIELIKNDKLRNFRVEIETDSTIAADEQADKQSRVEFITAVSEFVTAWGPILAATPQLAPMASEFLKFAIRGFKTGEALEAVVEQTMDSLMQQSAAPPQPDPAQEMQAQADQTKAQAEVIKAEAGVQKAGIDMQKANIEAQALPFKLLDSTGYSNAQDMTEGGL
jgi:hypothetical protein